MALEELLGKLITSLDANTAAYKASGGAVAGKAGSVTAGKPPRTTPAVEVTVEELKVAGKKVMDAHGKPHALKLIKDVGKAAEIAAVKPENRAALAAAFEKSLEPAEEAEATEVEEDGL
jgi:hypothetical protein